MFGQRSSKTVAAKEFMVLSASLDIIELTPGGSISRLAKFHTRHLLSHRTWKVNIGTHAVREKSDRTCIYGTSER
ncbi:hypothetical protein EVAR_66355_1 [Eumeta japonica]|uniref:Uncharacterized protein n=1 Tax=Eumeta variegata TaxID=151549 RepID=A0A4C1ZQX5_EUMVA|nr:hypothetical protein EVAR_66355_1 [Eumeta japonica]